MVVWYYANMGHLTPYYYLKAIGEIVDFFFGTLGEKMHIVPVDQLRQRRAVARVGQFIRG